MWYIECRVFFQWCNKCSWVAACWAKRGFPPLIYHQLQPVVRHQYQFSWIYGSGLIYTCLYGILLPLTRFPWHCNGHVAVFCLSRKFPVAIVDKSSVAVKLMSSIRTEQSINDALPFICVCFCGMHIKHVVICQILTLYMLVQDFKPLSPIIHSWMHNLRRILDLFPIFRGHTLGPTQD